jgi:hypothetical protein
VGAQDRQTVTGHPFYGINIWLHDPKARGKVLNIEWIDNRVLLRGFKRGDWSASWRPMRGGDCSALRPPLPSPATS